MLYSVCCTQNVYMYTCVYVFVVHLFIQFCKYRSTLCMTVHQENDHSILLPCKIVQFGFFLLLCWPVRKVMLVHLFTDGVCRDCCWSCHGGCLILESACATTWTTPLDYYSELVWAGGIVKTKRLCRPSFHCASFTQISSPDRMRYLQLSAVPKCWNDCQKVITSGVWIFNSKLGCGLCSLSDCFSGENVIGLMTLY